nr:Scr1 family TA system antitoxin-like transcriptional regulator [Actinomadura alba]
MFTVLTLDRMTRIAYFESAGHGHVVEDVDAVASYAERFELIRADALPVHESRKLITAIMEAT